MLGFVLLSLLVALCGVSWDWRGWIYLLFMLVSLWFSAAWLTVSSNGNFDVSFLVFFEAVSCFLPSKDSEKTLELAEFSELELLSKCAVDSGCTRGGCNSK